MLLLLERVLYWFPVIGAVVLTGCGVGTIQITPSPAVLPPASTISQSKAREVSVVAGPSIAQDQLAAINGYNVAGSLQQALTQSLAQGGHMNPAGLTKVTVVITSLRLRSPMHTGIAFGPDFIDATVEVVAPSGRIGAFNTRADSMMNVPMQEVRLSRLLTGLNQRIINGLGSVQAVVSQPAPTPSPAPPQRAVQPGPPQPQPAPPATVRPPPAQPAQSPPARGPENTADACRDGQDNDGDGRLDCADQDCSPLSFCAQTPSVPSQPTVPQARTPENTPDACRDGRDNDGDGHVDCADQNCSPLIFCSR